MWLDDDGGHDHGGGVGSAASVAAAGAGRAGSDVPIGAEALDALS